MRQEPQRRELRQPRRARVEQHGEIGLDVGRPRQRRRCRDRGAARGRRRRGPRAPSSRRSDTPAEAAPATRCRPSLPKALAPLSISRERREHDGHAAAKCLMADGKGTLVAGHDGRRLGEIGELEHLGEQAGQETRQRLAAPWSDARKRACSDWASANLVCTTSRSFSPGSRP